MPWKYGSGVRYAMLDYRDNIRIISLILRFLWNLYRWNSSYSGWNAPASLLNFQAWHQICKALNFTHSISWFKLWTSFGNLRKIQLWKKLQLDDVMFVWVYDNSLLPKCKSGYDFRKASFNIPDWSHLWAYS